MRASFLVMGPLLARLKKAKVSLPGGCVLGQRPVNLHLLGLAKLGVQIIEEHGYVIATAEELKGNTIYFDRPTHTGTENIIMAGALSQGKTTLINAACDPEVVDLANFLNLMGAKIEGAGTPVINIHGVKKLKAVEYSPIYDRLEASTYMMAAGITGGYIELKNIELEHLSPVVYKLKQMGVEIDANKGRLKIIGPKKLKATSITTYPHPGFPTDMQSSIMALATIADGTSSIRETVFEDRFTHVMEYIRLGADIKISGDIATINGVPKLKGASVMASDIRAGAGLVLAGLSAEGTTEVLRVYHIDRGYEKMEEKLSRLGAEIKRVKS
jgi:UDP-N-acetylglucosamine 1-carboxyvinyltransferase